MRYLFFLTIYFTLRLFSFFYTPPTPLLAGNWLNTIAAAAILLLVIYFIWKKDVRGWLIIAAEILLGGGGGFLSIGPVSLRTCLLAASLIIFFGQLIKKGGGLLRVIPAKAGIQTTAATSEKWIPVYTGMTIFVLILWAWVSAKIGFGHGHDARLVFADFVPYLFFLYYFPLRELWGEGKFRLTCFQMLIAAIIGNAIFTLLTFAGFSSGLFAVQGAYYHWFRDVAGGKITALDFNFYRIVLNEHLLLAPLLLLAIWGVIARSTFASLSVNSATKQSPGASNEIASSAFGLLAMTLALFAILSVNITRIYIIALLVGLLFLFTRQNWKKWLAVSLVSLACFCLTFTAIHLVASRGQSLGWELFGLRLQSIASPQIENSALSRIILLPKIWEKIKTAPIFGQGLGDTVTAFSPVFKQNTTTPHFDWGWLEIWAEMGAIGLIIWLALIVYLFVLLIKKTALEKPFYLAALGALLVINITSPALFHVFGVILLVSLFTLNRVSAAQSLAPSRIL